MTKLLKTLVKCDFIQYHRVKLKKISKKGGYYTLQDSFVQFYHSYLDAETNDAHYWTHNLMSPKTNNFYGLSFERVCMAHIPQIKHALGIDRIGVEYYSWRSKEGVSGDDVVTRGAQVDLLLERADRIINLCEMKYSIREFAIDKDEDLKLRNRQGAFRDETETKYAVVPIMVSTYGMKTNKYSGGIYLQVTMEDLFQDVRE